MRSLLHERRNELAVPRGLEMFGHGQRSSGGGNPMGEWGWRTTRCWRTTQKEKKDRKKEEKKKKIEKINCPFLSNFYG
jgi:hypothetical protein